MWFVVGGLWGEKNRWKKGWSYGEFEGFRVFGIFCGGGGGDRWGFFLEMLLWFVVYFVFLV